jgi:hypothetical protein
MDAFKAFVETANLFLSSCLVYWTPGIQPMEGYNITVSPLLREQADITVPHILLWSPSKTPKWVLPLC